MSGSTSLSDDPAVLQGGRVSCGHWATRHGRIDTYQPVAETLPVLPGVLVLIHDRDRVESDSLLPRRSSGAMP